MSSKNNIHNRMSNNLYKNRYICNFDLPELLCQASCHPAVLSVFCGLLSSTIKKKKILNENPNQFMWPIREKDIYKINKKQKIEFKLTFFINKVDISKEP